MLILDMDIAFENKQPVPNSLTKELTKKIMRWLHEQGIEGSLSIEGNTAKLCIMTDNWMEDDYEPFLENLRLGIQEALRTP